MSDESIWGPPPAGPAPVPVPVEPSSPPPHRSRGPIIAVVVGAVALIGAGVFAASRVFGDDSAGGADSPEAAGLALLDALDQEDALGVVDLLLPGERETLRQPLTELVDELTRIEVLSDDATLRSISRPRRADRGRQCRGRATNVDDIVNLRISAMATATVDGEALPIGDLVLDVAEGEPSELDVAAVGVRIRWTSRSPPSAKTAAGTSAWDTRLPRRLVPRRAKTSPRPAWRRSVATRRRTPWTTCSRASRRST